MHDTNFISLSTTDTLIIDFTTGITPPNSNSVMVYPNPSSDHLFIDNGNLNSMVGYSIKITNSLGQIVFNQPVNQQQFYIDLSTWGGNGVYSLFIIDAQQSIKEQKQIVLQ
ncbi:MAG: T9SS type A sorting domain-containing protein [Bacteroidetes bacterium]|nr:T9SS type A sorting domain-containing protein [Bacteroidota bacterium]